MAEVSLRRRELGRRLRKEITREGVSGSDLAARMQIGRPVLSRMLTGHRLVTDLEVTYLLATVRGRIEPDHAQIVALASPAQDQALRMARDEAWSLYLVHSRDATRVREFQPMFVPWPVQIPEYTRALLSESHEPDSAASVLTRRRGAVSLLRTGDVQLLMHEYALHTKVGSNELMREQISHLRRMSCRPGVSVRIIPAACGGMAARHGGFSLLEFAEHPVVLYREDNATGVLADLCPDVTVYESAIETLATAALDEQDSRSLLDSIESRFDAGTTPLPIQQPALAATS